MTEADNAIGMARVTGAVGTKGGTNSTAVGGDHHWANVSRMDLSPSGHYVQRHAYGHHESRKPDPRPQFRVVTITGGMVLSETFTDYMRMRKIWGNDIDSGRFKVQERKVTEWVDRL
jgi:hypothetical protein